MKATLKGRYEVNKCGTAVATVAVHAGDVRAKASFTDATFVSGSSLDGLALALEKPDAFILDYSVPNKGVRFQFMNSVHLLDKTVNFTYSHTRWDNRTLLDGSVALDPSNKLTVSYAFGTPAACKVKYVYTHGESRRTVLEPCYDVSENAWDFAVTRKFERGGSLKGTYNSTTKNLGIEWCRDLKDNASFSISANVNLAEEQKKPKLVAESSWNFEIDDSVTEGSTDTKEGDGTTNDQFPAKNRSYYNTVAKASYPLSIDQFAVADAEPSFSGRQECEELARKLTDLNSENNVLRIELENLKKLSGELEVENKSIMVELKETYGSEFLSGLGSLH